MVVDAGATCCQSPVPICSAGLLLRAGALPCVLGQCSQGVVPSENLGKTPILASRHRSESLGGSWESVCFIYSWKILIRSPALQGGMMDSTCES